MGTLKVSGPWSQYRWILWTKKCPNNNSEDNIISTYPTFNKNNSHTKQYTSRFYQYKKKSCQVQVSWFRRSLSLTSKIKLFTYFIFSLFHKLTNHIFEDYFSNTFKLIIVNKDIKFALIWSKTSISSPNGHNQKVNYAKSASYKALLC